MAGCIRSSVAKFHNTDHFSRSDPLETGKESFPVFFFVLADPPLWILDKLSPL